MKKHNIITKFKYWLDKRMTKGMISMIELLGLLTIIIILVLVLALLLFGRVSENNVGNVTWEVISAVFNGEMPGFVENNRSTFILVISAIMGLLFTSVLIGIISNAIEERLDKLSNGNSSIIEDVDTLIIGFNNVGLSVLKQLIDANRNQKKKNYCYLR